MFSSWYSFLQTFQIPFFVSCSFCKLFLSLCFLGSSCWWESFLWCQCSFHEAALAQGKEREPIWDWKAILHHVRSTRYKYSRAFLSFSIAQESYPFHPIIKSIYSGKQKHAQHYQNDRTFSRSAYWHSSHDQFLMCAVRNSYISGKSFYDRVSRLKFVCPEAKKLLQ